MLVPAINYKEEIEKQFALLQYTDKMLWYTGSIDNYDMEVKTEGDKYAFAIVHSGQAIGYISFRVDWYCSMAFNFSLIKFLPHYFDNTKQEYRDSTPLMVSAIREVMRMVESFNLHRIDFRCVSGNPAEVKYWRILKLIEKSGKWYWHGIKFADNIKDRHGDYHDTICYELIRRQRMTNKDAISNLEDMKSYITSQAQLDSINLAIKALEEKEERSKHPSELHRIVAHKEEADRAADALDKHIAEWEAKYGSKI